MVSKLEYMLGIHSWSDWNDLGSRRLNVRRLVGLNQRLGHGIFLTLAEAVDQCLLSEEEVSFLVVNIPKKQSKIKRVSRVTDIKVLRAQLRKLWDKQRELRGKLERQKFQKRSKHQRPEPPKKPSKKMRQEKLDFFFTG